MSVLLLNGEQHWVCPNCTTTAVTQGQPNRFHDCPGLKGLSAPMVIAGTDCKVEAHVREDYVGAEKGLQVDGDGRPIMSVVTTRADGSNDTAVFAPSARMFTNA